MTESESVALPFGDSPMSCYLKNYTRSISILQYPNSKKLLKLQIFFNALVAKHNASLMHGHQAGKHCRAQCVQRTLWYVIRGIRQSPGCLHPWDFDALFAGIKSNPKYVDVSRLPKSLTQSPATWLLYCVTGLQAPLICRFPPRHEQSSCGCCICP